MLISGLLDALFEDGLNDVEAGQVADGNLQNKLGHHESSGRR
jgi:hypothetical protein